MHQSQDHYILYRSVRILEGACVALLLFAVFVLALFFLGNYQEFLDSSQDFLLNILQFSSLLCALSAFYYLGGLLIWMVRRKHFMLWRLLFGVLALGVSVVLLLGTNLLLVVLLPVFGATGQ